MRAALPEKDVSNAPPSRLQRDVCMHDAKMRATASLTAVFYIPRMQPHAKHTCTGPSLLSPEHFSNNTTQGNRFQIDHLRA
jgi:hypothetical protein